MTDFRKRFETEYCRWRGWETGAMQACVDPELHMRYPVAVYRLPETTVAAVAEEIADAVPYLKTLPKDISFPAIMEDLFTDITMKTDLAFFTVLEEEFFTPYAGEEPWQIRKMEMSDRRALSGLLQACTRKERIQGAVSVEDPECLGLWEGRRLVACASVWYWGDVLADLGVVTHPRWRGKGAATCLVSTLCREMLARGKMPLYRYEDGNEASARVCEKLGFRKAACLEGAQVFYDETEEKQDTE